MTKAILYARFSPRPGADRSESIKLQLQACHDYCERVEYEVAGEYEDRALSGADEDRPGLWEAVDALGRGYVLVVHKLDRLARDVYLSELLHREAKRAGARIEAVEGGSNGTSPEQEYVRQILQASAAYERKVTALRTKYAMLRLQSMGKSMTSIPPYGWEFDPNSPMNVKVGKDGKLHETVRSRTRQSDAEQAVIRQIIELNEQGLSLRGICKELTGQGIDHRGGKWYHQQVRSILRRAGAR